MEVNSPENIKADDQGFFRGKTSRTRVLSLLLLLLLLFFLINLFVLDYRVFRKETPVLSPAPGELPAAEIEAEEATAGAQPARPAQDACPRACLELISESTVSGQKQIVPTKTLPLPVVKEVYVPLGTGSTTSRDYKEMVGVEAVIDLDHYPPIKSVIFEATLRIPTANGRVYAKLFNVTDQHDAWNSEVYTEKPEGYRAEANDVSLASGRKLYRVMMKSTLGYEAVLDGARVKIVLE